jgi:hypothetical protein
LLWQLLILDSRIRKFVSALGKRQVLKQKV